MGEKDLFLDLYEKDLIRLRLHDGTQIFRSVEQSYWDRVIHPDKQQSKEYSDNQIAEKMRELNSRINATVEKMKLRYGLENVDTDIC